MRYLYLPIVIALLIPASACIVPPAGGIYGTRGYGYNNNIALERSIQRRRRGMRRGLGGFDCIDRLDAQGRPVADIAGTAQVPGTCIEALNRRTQGNIPTRQEIREQRYVNRHRRAMGLYPQPILIINPFADSEDEGEVAFPDDCDPDWDDDCECDSSEEDPDDDGLGEARPYRP